ncbi:MAG: GNAT family N-acetyltransferase [Rhizobiales bacterium 35-68-8]|nr:MAG: GNAT family N-acetyltransferase [Rhizobiales bacterium 35-68-8]
MLIRPARPDDIAAILPIYVEAVLHGTATFELEPPNEAEMARRMQALLDGKLPYFVAEIGGHIAGYAYAAPFRPRPAYRFTVEDSVYIAPDMHRRGVGKALIVKLIETCTALGFRQMIAVIGDSAQAASIGVHAACGFTPAGNLKSVGWKFGQWLDTPLMQLALGEGSATTPA